MTNDDTPQTHSEFWLFVTSSGSEFFISEESAITIAAQFKRGDPVLEFDGILGGPPILVAKELFGELFPSTPAIRLYVHAMTAMLKEEKKAAGYYDEP